MVAEGLSADPSNTVVVLEAGPEDSDKRIHIPATWSRSCFAPSVDWDYLTEPQPQLNGRQNLLAARQDARRLIVDERDDVGARLCRRLRRVGAARGR